MSLPGKSTSPAVEHLTTEEAGWHHSRATERRRVSATRETEWARRQRRDRERAEHVAAHGPACMICRNTPKRGLDQDHDHKTGKTRGWLCHRCNRALPVWVTPEWLRLAADYLERAT